MDRKRAPARKWTKFNTSEPSLICNRGNMRLDAPALPVVSYERSA